ncbi:MAG TPA: NfeD family protein [Phenylobacterium sp.]|uniref:NfeD family protein n=1 Tax=Phenylobacterium sp. TaxID=1871053 RepID=UPI002B45F7AE|nr:NfeD family protein [Phenylobacterium sp.]HKR87563.1 NfeD family protein [Phenylobacterium sp.]
MFLFTDLYLGHSAWIWAAVGAALLAAEVLAGSGWLLWPAAAAGIVAVIDGFSDLHFKAAVLIFAGLTIVSTLTARRYFPRRRSAEGQDINDNIARLVGHEGRVVVAFEGGAGRVFVDGKEWPAELEAGETIAAGARVAVAGVSGVRLKVREL